VPGFEEKITRCTKKQKLLQFEETKQASESVEDMA
jgi:hypothetical protein